MKEIYKEYWNETKKLLQNKTYVYTIIFIAILSYGFTITNFSIGIDDLCFDRYVTGPYILSAGRWGTTLLYSVFQIFSFTPFWVELVVTILTVFMGIIFTVFINKTFNGELKTIHCIIITGLLISYPILHQSFIYQSTNLCVIICNIVLMTLPIIIYENCKRKVKYRNTIFIMLILPLFISMYESCCQTYILMVAIIMFLEVYNKRNEKTTKNVIKYFFIAILILIGALLINILINIIIKLILHKSGMLMPDFSSKSIPWLKYDLKVMLNLLKSNVLIKLCSDFRKLLFVKEFVVFGILTLLFAVEKSITNRKYLLIPLILIIIFSNFAINLLQVRVLYRVDTSWCIALAFFATIILTTIKDKELNCIISIAFCILILFQTKQMNQYFYNDYIRYQREASYMQYIANEIIIKCEDTTKPLIYLVDENKGTHQNKINEDNGWSIIDWGVASAFGLQGAELTKFINSLGYNFKVATNEQVEDAYESCKNVININNNEIIYEMDEYIFVIIEYKM